MRLNAKADAAPTKTEIKAFAEASTSEFLTHVKYGTASLLNKAA